MAQLSSNHTRQLQALLGAFSGGTSRSEGLLNVLVIDQLAEIIFEALQNYIQLLGGLFNRLLIGRQGIILNGLFSNGV